MNVSVTRKLHRCAGCNQVIHPMALEETELGPMCADCRELPTPKFNLFVTDSYVECFVDMHGLQLWGRYLL